MGWGIFCGNGVGMGKISWGRDGDGENFMGMGRGWGQFYLPCHSLVIVRVHMVHVMNADSAQAAADLWT